MRKQLLRVSFVILALCANTWGQAQSPAPGDGPFAGRWEIQVKDPTAAAAVSFFIVEIAGGSTPTAKVIDTMGSPMMSAKVKDVSIKGDELVLAVDLNMLRQLALVFRGKRVGDHLEGSATAEGESEPATWTGRTTTLDKLAPPVMPAASADTKAYTAAASKPPAERVAALQQFIKDFPDSKLKESATLQLAQSYPTPAEKIAALQKFIADYPASALKDQANLQIALAPAALTERAASLRKFIADFPASRLKEQAEFQLIGTNTDAAPRLAAQEEFVKAHPKSAFAPQVYQALMDAYMRAQPIDEAKLGGAIDGYIGSTPDMTVPTGQFTISMRAGSMNTVADRLMTSEVMLDKALDLIQKAVSMAGEKEEPRSRSIYITTLGQVLFKLKRYDDAERELKRAIATAGGDGDGDAYLFLGKIYENRNDDAAALDAYFKSVEIGPTADSKVSLRRAWTKKNGSVAGLEEKLDELYRARPKPFAPGTFTRSKGQDRVVLAELFTGAECVPCVGADLAFDGIAERYDHKSVAVLIYHLHVPGPDPLTNADTEARSKYYEVRGTPTAVVDGTPSNAGGGGPAQSEKLFSGLKGMIESRFDKKPLATLSGFKASVSGKTITVSGQADLAPGTEKITKATLHVALVQDSVRYTGANGVRFHSYVVRSLLGSPEGTVLKTTGTRTKFSEKVDVPAIGEALDAYLTKYETGHSRPNVPFAFSDRVDHLEPGQLRVVAFVQDDATKEILQAVFIDPKR